MSLHAFLQQQYLQHDTVLKPLAMASLQAHDTQPFNALCKSAPVQTILDYLFDTYVRPIADEVRVDTLGHLKAYDGKTLAALQDDHNPYAPFLYANLKKSLQGAVAFLIQDIYQASITPDHTDPIFSLDILPTAVKVNEINCPDCGASVRLWLSLSDKTLRPEQRMIDRGHQTPCPIHADDDQVIRARIEVPSGRLVFANDLRVLIPEVNEAIDEAIGYSVSGHLERKLRTQQFAEQAQMLYCFVGNSSPEVVQTPDGLMVANAHDYFKALYSASETEWEVHALDECGDVKGQVITDLWAYMAMDAERFHALKATQPDLDDFDHFEVEVTPGTYEVEHLYRSKRFNGVDSWIRHVA